MKRRAKDFAHAWIKEHESKETKRTSQIRFDHAFEEYLSLKTCRDSTSKNYRMTYEGVYQPRFGEKYLDEIELLELEKFFKKPRKNREVGAVTKRKYLTELRSFFTWAARHRYLTQNPCEGIKLPRAPKRQGIALTLEEARKLLQVAKKPVVLKVKDRTKKRGSWKQKFTPPEHLWLGLLIALHTGLRRGNVTGLTWRHIDLKKRKITFSAEEMKAFADHEVPVHPELAETLEAILKSKKTINLDEPVLGLELKEITKSFKAALRRAKLPEMRWHDLRHTAATWWSTRCPFAALQQLLAHSPGHVTFKYIHVPFEELQKVVDSMPRLLPQDQENKDIHKAQNLDSQIS